MARLQEDLRNQLASAVASAKEEPNTQNTFYQTGPLAQPPAREDPLWDGLCHGTLPAQAKSAAKPPAAAKALLTIKPVIKVWRDTKAKVTAASKSMRGGSRCNLFKPPWAKPMGRPMSRPHGAAAWGSPMGQAHGADP